MAIDALVEPLLSLPLFRDLKPLQLTEIVRRAERVVFRPGDIIAAENQVADAATIIISGSCIRLNDSGSVSHRSRGEILPHGALISELAMLVEVVHASTIIAQSSVRALRLRRDGMLELMQEDPSLAEHFSRHILERLQLLAEELNAIDAAFTGWAAETPPQIALSSAAHAANHAAH
jgi:CRP-like cAMP-binding protein